LTLLPLRHADFHELPIFRPIDATLAAAARRHYSSAAAAAFNIAFITAIDISPIFFAAISLSSFFVFDY
jgi:hypothetical protein